MEALPGSTFYFLKQSQNSDFSLVLCQVSYTLSQCSPGWLTMIFHKRLTTLLLPASITDSSTVCCYRPLLSARFIISLVCCRSVYRLLLLVMMLRIYIQTPMHSFGGRRDRETTERATEGDKYEVNEVRKLEQGDRWRWREMLMGGSGCVKEEETLRA